MYEAEEIAGIIIHEAHGDEVTGVIIHEADSGDALADDQIDEVAGGVLKGNINVVNL